MPTSRSITSEHDVRTAGSSRGSVADEQIFRLILIAGAVVIMPVAIYHRVRSQAGGESLDRRQEGLAGTRSKYLPAGRSSDGTGWRRPRSSPRQSSLWIGHAPKSAP